MTKPKPIPCGECGAPVNYDQNGRFIGYSKTCPNCEAPVLAHSWEDVLTKAPRKVKKTAAREEMKVALKALRSAKVLVQGLAGEDPVPVRAIDRSIEQIQGALFALDSQVSD